MIRGACALLICAAVLSAGGLDQAPRFRSRTDLVSVDVAVTRNGRPMSDLGAADLLLTDNGVRQTIEIVDARALPLDLTIVLDTSDSMWRAIDDLRRDAASILAMLRPSDRVRLMTFAGDVRETVPFQPPSSSLSLQHLTAAGSTSLFDAVAAAMLHEPDASPADERRHLIVVLTDAQDTSSVLGLGPLDEISRRTDAVLYAAVGGPFAPVAPPVPSPSPRRRVGEQIYRRNWHPPLAAMPGDTGPLRRAVSNTGGIWDGMRSIGQAADGVRRALEWFRAAYVVRYRASGVATPGWHELRLRVTRPGNYEVRARRGYYGAG